MPKNKSPTYYTKQQCNQLKQILLNERENNKMASRRKDNVQDTTKTNNNYLDFQSGNFKVRVWNTNEKEQDKYNASLSFINGDTSLFVVQCVLRWSAGHQTYFLSYPSFKNKDNEWVEIAHPVSSDCVSQIKEMVDEINKALA